MVRNHQRTITSTTSNNLKEELAIISLLVKSYQKVIALPTHPCQIRGGFSLLLGLRKHLTVSFPFMY